MAWRALNNPDFGLMNILSESIGHAQFLNPYLLPDLRDSKTLLITSDYSGQHEGCLFESYSFLVMPVEHLSIWEPARVRVRRQYLLRRRRFAFAKLGDRRKREALNSFLGAAHNIPGVCATILIDKSIESMFHKEGRLQMSGPEFEKYAHYKIDTFERLLRVVHFVSFFIAGLSAPDQNIFWFTDQDDIAANPRGVTELTQVGATVLGNYLPHMLGHIRCGSTVCDDGSLQIEDLAAIPDLAAGTLAEVISAYKSQGYRFVSPLTLPVPQNVSSKARSIMGWLSEPSHLLKHLVFVIEPKAGSAGLTITHLNFHS